MVCSLALVRRDPVDAGHGEVDDPEAGCKLLDTFAIVIQLCLAAAAFSTLIYKRYRERPQRPVLIWGMDVSKQFVGGVVIHSLNVLVSYFSGKGDEEGPSNPCVWYFLNIFVDTTVGVLILWGFLRLWNVLFEKLGYDGMRSGKYGLPPLSNQLKRWARQCGVFILSLVLMKGVVVLLFAICPWLFDFGSWVLQWTMGNYRLQVVFVMLVFPLIMNILQFWIVDTIVKEKPRKEIRLEKLDDDDDDEEMDRLEARKLLFDADADPFVISDEDDDDLHPQHLRDDIEYGHRASTSKAPLLKKDDEDDLAIVVEPNVERTLRDHSVSARKALADQDPSPSNRPENTSDEEMADWHKISPKSSTDYP
ncbi:hypothetical protein BZG36_00657 [Bifiguratus adelaidae]|uniref:Vacuolar membrane protein n=1 Tax=Bifiguratus adelaidae TaxID=1938954 RepID=A0A261Y6U9_9FUNG|nr:hypothetical protein BZG36_00657 [Bifiguratus adelaidae]